MKQRFVLSLAFVCAFMVTTRAQISKGTVWVGGNVSYNSQKTDFSQNTPDYKNNKLSINPAIGTAVKDNLVVGIRLSYENGKTENNGALSEIKTHSYGGGVFVRQYFPVITRLYIFGDAGASFTSSKTDDTHIDNNTKVTTTYKTKLASLGITPGIAFAVTKKFQLETSLNNLLSVAYLNSKSGDPNPVKTTQITGGVFSDGKAEFNIGCRFLLGNKG